MKNRNEMRTGLLFLLPSMAGIAVFFIVPFVISVSYTFSSTSGSFNFAGLSNYVSLFSSVSFRQAFANTSLFIVCGMAALLVLGLPFAVILDRLMGRRSRMASAGLIPMVIPTSAISLFIHILFERYGVLNGILAAAGSDTVIWKQAYPFVILLLIYMWKNLGYHILVYYAGLRSLEKTLLEEAESVGCNRWQLFIYIQLPHLRSFISFSAVLAIIGVFRVYRESYMLFGEYPPSSVYMIQNFLNNNFYNLNFQRLSTASFFLILPLSVIQLTVLMLGRDENE